MDKIIIKALEYSNKEIKELFRINLGENFDAVSKIAGKKLENLIVSESKEINTKKFYKIVKLENNKVSDINRILKKEIDFKTVFKISEYEIKNGISNKKAFCIFNYDFKFYIETEMKAFKNNSFLQKVIKEVEKEIEAIQND